MEALAVVVGVLLMGLGVVTAAVPGIPGTALAYAGILLIAWSDGFARIGVWMLVGLGAIAVIGSVIDNVAGLFGARYAGASGWGVLGAAVGGLIGLVFGLLGAVVGTAVGAVLVEYVRNPDFRRAARAGAGSFLGFLVGAIAKSLLTIVMVVLAFYAFFS